MKITTRKTVTVELSASDLARLNKEIRFLHAAAGEIVPDTGTDEFDKTFGYLARLLREEE